MTPGPADPHALHFAAAAPDIRARLAAIRAEVERSVPAACACIGYRMPAFRLRRVFFYFAAFRHHIGIYPPLAAPPALVAELAPWRGPKGNLSFRHDAPLPLDLIGRLAGALATQYG